MQSVSPNFPARVVQRTRDALPGGVLWTSLLVFFLTLAVAKSTVTSASAAGSPTCFQVAPPSSVRESDVTPTTQPTFGDRTSNPQIASPFAKIVVQCWPPSPDLLSEEPGQSKIVPLGPDARLSLIHI